MLQRHPDARREYKKDGCYCYCGFDTAERYTNFRISQEYLNEIFEDLIKTGAIDRECFVLDPDRLHAFFGIITELRQDFEHDAYPHHAPPDYRCGPGEFEYLRFYLDGSHFVNGNGNGVVTHDPWGSWNGRDPYSKTVTYGRLMDKRVFRLVEVL